MSIVFVMWQIPSRENYWKQLELKKVLETFNVEVRIADNKRFRNAKMRSFFPLPDLGL